MSKTKYNQKQVDEFQQLHVHSVLNELGETCQATVPVQSAFDDLNKQLEKKIKIRSKFRLRIKFESKRT